MVKRAQHSDPQAVAERQASNIMKSLQGSVINSVKTVKNYEERLTVIAKTINAEFNVGLKQLTVEQANQYLADRSNEVGQKTLDMERQALQCMMQSVTNKLEPNEKLNIEKSDIKPDLSSRSYTESQVKIISEAQSERHSLSTEIAHSAGLRAHELYTLRRIEERQPDIRENKPTLEEKFQGRDNGERYTVAGKGGLIREVVIPTHLADKLEDKHLDEPRFIEDRGVHYQTHYDIGGGQKWSNSFSSASTRALGWSHGAHGLRHSYAQERMDELRISMSHERALEVVSQEMGHFRASITEIYLR